MRKKSFGWKIQFPNLSQNGEQILYKDTDDTFDMHKETFVCTSLFNLTSPYFSFLRFSVDFLVIQ